MVMTRLRRCVSSPCQEGQSGACPDCPSRPGKDHGCTACRARQGPYYLGFGPGKFRRVGGPGRGGEESSAPPIVLGSYTCTEPGTGFADGDGSSK